MCLSAVCMCQTFFFTWVGVLSTCIGKNYFRSMGGSDFGYMRVRIDRFWVLAKCAFRKKRKNLNFSTLNCPNIFLDSFIVFYIQNNICVFFCGYITKGGLILRAKFWFFSDLVDFGPQKPFSHFWPLYFDTTHIEYQGVWEVPQFFFVLIIVFQHEKKYVVPPIPPGTLYMWCRNIGG
jgi:hypothetical protein